MFNFSEKTQKFIDSYNFDSNILFTWNTWVWKTSIMRALFQKVPEEILKYWIDDGQVREFITSWNFSLRNQSEQHDKIAFPMSFFPLEMCVNSKVLFFDDIGSSENVSDSQKTKIKFILDEREKKWYITIFSTNLSPKQIENLYWERIKSRIYDWTEKKMRKWLKIVNIDWEDRRKVNIETISL